MKILFIILIVPISLMAITSHAKANGPFYVEPYTGYFMGDIEGDNFQNGDLSSLYVGLRIGVEMKNGLILGVDYGQSRGEFDPDNSNVEADYEQKDIGAYIGYRVTPYVRIFGSYIFKYESEFDWDDNTPDTNIEGSGFNAGVSLKVASNIKLGVEYQTRDLKEFGSGTSIVGSNKSEAYMLTLQLPVPLPFAIR